MKTAKLLILVSLLVGCNESKDKGQTAPESPMKLTEVQKECIRNNLITVMPWGPYDAVRVYRSCGGPDDKEAFSAAAEELFVMDAGKIWSLR